MDAGDKICDFISQAKLTREQIISISAHETTGSDEDEGDSEVVIFYRRQSDPTDSVIQNARCRVSRDIAQSFESLALADCRYASDKAFVGFTSTPKQIGQMNVSLTWTDAGAGLNLHAKHFTVENSNWEKLQAEVVEWLNNSIAPHQFKAYSVLQEDHPSKEGKTYAQVIYSGEAATKLVLPENVQAPLYTSSIVTREAYDSDIYNDVAT